MNVLIADLSDFRAFTESDAFGKSVFPSNSFVHFSTAPVGVEMLTRASITDAAPVPRSTGPAS